MDEAQHGGGGAGRTTERDDALPRRSSDRRLVWLGLSATVLLVFAYSLLWDVPVERSDTAGYYEVAQDLDDFRLEQIHFRPPGYPLFLRLLGFGEVPASQCLVVVGLALRMGAVWSVVYALAALGFSIRVRIAFFALACLPPFAQSAAYVLSESLTDSLLAVALSALLLWYHDRHWRWLTVSALGLAAAGLTKPTYQLLGPVLGVALTLSLAFLVIHGAKRNRRVGIAEAVRAGTLLAALSLLPILVYAGFNKFQFGTFTVSPGNLPYSLSTKTVRVLERLPEEHAAAREAMIIVRDAHLVERGSSHTAEQYYPAARAAVSAATGLQGSDLDSYMLDLQLELIARAPLQYLLHVGHSMVSFWFPNVSTVTFGSSHLAHGFWSLVQFSVVFVFFFQAAVLFGAGVFAWSRRQSAASGAVASQGPEGGGWYAWWLAYGMPLLVISYTFAISCIVHHGDPRFRSANELLVLQATVVGLAIWNRSRKRPA